MNSEFNNTETTLEGLLKELYSVRQRYEEAAALAGENWNIFYAIGKTDYEKELLHSYFISRLLDSQTNLRKDNVFLKLFLETVQEEYKDLEPYFSGFDQGAVRVETEKYIGPVSKDYESGGRIDIFIESGKKQLVIENKVIYAGDQPKQLYRYNKAYPDAEIIYLTMNGKDATKDSLWSLSKKYYPMSYQKHILKWLEKCLAVSKESSFISMAIKQYILLIKDLTGQGRNPEMTKEIIDILIKDKESFSGAVDVFSNLKEAKNNVIINRLLQPLEVFLKERNTYIQMETISNDQGLSGFRINIPEWKKICLCFNLEGNTGIYGFRFLSDKTDNNHIRTGIKNNFGAEQTPWWPLIYRIDSFRFWELETVKYLFNEDNAALTYYKEKINELLDIANQLKNQGIEL